MLQFSWTKNVYCLQPASWSSLWLGLGVVRCCSHWAAPPSSKAGESVLAEINSLPGAPLSNVFASATGPARLRRAVGHEEQQRNNNHAARYNQWL